MPLTASPVFVFPCFCFVSGFNEPLFITVAEDYAIIFFYRLFRYVVYIIFEVLLDVKYRGILPAASHMSAEIVC